MVDLRYIHCEPMEIFRQAKRQIIPDKSPENIAAAEAAGESPDFRVCQFGDVVRNLKESEAEALMSMGSVNRWEKVEDVEAI